jgi:hypothetical protein
VGAEQLRHEGVHAEAKVEGRQLGGECRFVFGELVGESGGGDEIAGLLVQVRQVKDRPAERRSEPLGH